MIFFFFDKLNDDLRIEFNEGIIFSEIDNVIPYESSIPLLYEGYFLDKEISLNAGPVSVKACNIANNDLCNYTKWMDQIK